ncbi:hypothetical protein I552_2686 [Mycobacterium xenopi 3993]|nr:hypothetical protein I552_2686 [Mycobacterium xenopi 3993]
MMSSIAAGSTPDRRTVSSSTVVANTSAGVLTNEPLNDVPIAVRTAFTITGLGMASNSNSYRNHDDKRVGCSGGRRGCALRVEAG